MAEVDSVERDGEVPGAWGPHKLARIPRPNLSTVRVHIEIQGFPI